MNANELYCRLRYREDDPLRYQHVPRREREDTDANHTHEVVHDAELDLVETEMGSG